MKRKIGLAIFIVVLAAAVLGGIKTMQIRKLIAAGAAFSTPPESVSSFVVCQEQWRSTLKAIGSVTAVQGVLITPEVAGVVRELAFESGATVARGDLLVRLDISSEQAQLSAIEAQVQLAVLNLERAKTLRSQNMIAQAELDTAEATLKQLQGNADTIRATIEKKTIRAPFNGQLGIRQVNLGQYLDTGKPIVSLQALTPAYADFALPQQELEKLKTGMAVRLETDAYPGKSFEGTLSAINPDLDPSTRSVRLQATLANTEKLLRPGMFVRVEVLLPEQENVIVIPATSVVTAPYGDSVYIIEPGKTESGKDHLVVRQQFIRTGRTRGDYLTVETGLKGGEKIVSAGGFKLRNGTAIVETNELVPKAEQAPHPADA